MRRTSGISLVALVITIIILIILTGAVVATFMEGGIVDRARESTFKSDIRTYQEQLISIRAEEQMAIATEDDDYTGPEVIGKTLTEEDDIKEILSEFNYEKYGALLQIEDGKLVATKELNPEVKEENWLIQLGIGLGADEKFDTGVEVIIGGENFYVLKDNGSTLTLLAEKNITIEKPYVQSTSAPKIAFSSTNYWSIYEGWYPLNLNNNYVSNRQEGDALKMAETYASNIGAIEGRLMTVEEIVQLGGKENEYGTYEIKECPTWIKKDDAGNSLDYWIGVAYGSTVVYFVKGNTDMLDASMYNGNYGGTRGVRPVITISETKVKRVSYEA